MLDISTVMLKYIGMKQQMDIQIYIYIEIWLFNIAMENHHFNRIKNFIYTSSISMGNFPVRYVKQPEGKSYVIAIFLGLNPMLLPFRDVLWTYGWQR